jgi:DNA topoisomerase-1
MADGAHATPIIKAPNGKRLSYCHDDLPGLHRRGTGHGFSYVDQDGSTVRDPDTLERIRSLAIPPAWTDVWICPEALGHIQATGRDAKGRKQYRYHDLWSSHRADTKFGRMAAFGRALPRIRKRVEADLSRRGISRDKVLATVVRLMELTQIRVGNKEYARLNKSYGLTTLHKRHVAVDGTALHFHFKGKSGVDHRSDVRDRRLATILKGLHDLPGQQLFKYRDESGELVAIGSGDVNAYIRDIAGDDFSAKDFRTWAGTISAARALRMEPVPASPTEAKRRVTKCVRAVSGVLGNTPAVCRSSYVHPAVIEAYAKGTLKAAFPGPETAGFERALIKFLETAN